MLLRDSFRRVGPTKVNRDPWIYTCRSGVGQVSARSIISAAVLALLTLLGPSVCFVVPSLFDGSSYGLTWQIIFGGAAISVP